MHTMHAGTWLCCIVIVAHVVDTPTHTRHGAHAGRVQTCATAEHAQACPRHHTAPAAAHTRWKGFSCCVCYTRLVWLAYKREKYTALGGRTFLQQPAGKVQLAITQCLPMGGNHFFATACWKGTTGHHSAAAPPAVPLHTPGRVQAYTMASGSSYINASSW